MSMITLKWTGGRQIYAGIACGHRKYCRNRPNGKTTQSICFLELHLTTRTLDNYPFFVLQCALREATVFCVIPTQKVRLNVKTDGSLSKFVHFVGTDIVLHLCTKVFKVLQPVANWMLSWLYLSLSLFRRCKEHMSLIGRRSGPAS